MALYLISSKHEPEECLRAMDEELKKGSEVLDKFYFGCKDGDHTAYALVDVKDKDEALSLVPDFLQEAACITRVYKFTPADIKSLHTRAA